MTGSDANGLQHVMTIPLDTTYKVLAFSSEVTLADPDQKAVPDAGGTHDVKISSTGSPNLTLTFKVTGKR